MMYELKHSRRRWSIQTRGRVQELRGDEEKLVKSSLRSKISEQGAHLGFHLPRLGGKGTRNWNLKVLKICVVCA